MARGRAEFLLVLPALYTANQHWPGFGKQRKDRCNDLPWVQFANMYGRPLAAVGRAAIVRQPAGLRTCGDQPASRRRDGGRFRRGGNRRGRSGPRPSDPGAVDLRTLPKLEQAKYVLRLRRASHRRGISRGDARRFLPHYRADALEKLGWQLAAPLAKSDVTEEGASALWVKDENAIFLSASPLLTTIAGKTLEAEDPGPQFSIDYLGTSDSSKLPQLARRGKRVLAAGSRRSTSPT